MKCDDRKKSKFIINKKRNEINLGAKEKPILASLIDVKIRPKNFTYIMLNS